MSNYPPGNDPYNQQPPPNQPYPGDPYQGYPPQGQPPKKKNKVLMWSLIGCGSLVVIGIVVVIAFTLWVRSNVDMGLAERNPGLAAAKLAISLNSDLELVSIDESKGTLTVKDKKTGQVVTINADQAQQGKITVNQQGKEGVTIDGSGGSVKVEKGNETATFGAGSNASLPDWVPAYPGADMESLYSTSTNEANAVGFTFTTDDSPAEVINFYESELKSEGFKVTTSTTNTNGQVTSQVTAQNSDYSRIAFVNATVESGSTKVMLAITIKK